MMPVTTDVDSARSEIRDKSMVAIDVRPPGDYSRGHVPSAVNLPLASLLEDDSPGRVARIAGSLGVGDDTRVVVYDNTFGALASRIAWTLEYIGHREVSLLGVTFDQWKSMGLEVDTAAAEPRQAQHGHEAQPSILATHDYLDGGAAAAARRDDVVLVDNRERLNFLEQHIPGAISMPYRTLGGPGGILRDGGDMRRLFANRGIADGSEIITYCGSVGTLSGLGYYALKSAGFDNVRLYVRSFREWKSLEKPVSRQDDANYWDLSAE